MLRTVLSISGKPGLYKLVSNAKNMVVVESIGDKKRLPIYARDKVVSLGDIAIYTDDAEVPLKDVLISIKEKENGAKASTAPNAKPEELKAFLEAVLPNYDRDRVYNADIKKLIQWYNLLIEGGIEFWNEQQFEEEPTESAE